MAPKLDAYKLFGKLLNVDNLSLGQKGVLFKPTTRQLFIASTPFFLYDMSFTRSVEGGLCVSVFDRACGVEGVFTVIGCDLSDEGVTSLIDFACEKISYDVKRFDNNTSFDHTYLDSVIYCESVGIESDIATLWHKSVFLAGVAAPYSAEGVHYIVAPGTHKMTSGHGTTLEKNCNMHRAMLIAGGYKGIVAGDDGCVYASGDSCNRLIELFRSFGYELKDVEVILSEQPTPFVGRVFHRHGVVPEISKLVARRIVRAGRSAENLEL